MINIYIADTSCLNNDQLFAEKITNLPVWRQQKTLSIKAKKSRVLSLGAGLLLSIALENYGICAKSAEFYTNEYGKPYLKNHSVYFNLSHSGKYVFCAIADNELGVDIQKTGRYDKNIVNRFFHPDEQAYISSLPETYQAAAFFRIWALKESYVKALGTGLANMLNSFSIKFSDMQAYAYSNNKVAPYYFTEYRIDTYFAAICSKNQTAAPQLQQIDLSMI